MTLPDVPDEVAQRKQLLAWLKDGRARRWREISGHTQASAARWIGVSVGTFSRWERLIAEPRGAAALRYHALLDSWRPASASAAIAPAGGPDE